MATRLIGGQRVEIGSAEAAEIEKRWLDYVPAPVPMDPIVAAIRELARELPSGRKAAVLAKLEGK